MLLSLKPAPALVGLLWDLPLHQPSSSYAPSRPFWLHLQPNGRETSVPDGPCGFLPLELRSRHRRRPCQAGLPAPTIECRVETSAPRSLPSLWYPGRNQWGVPFYRRGNGGRHDVISLVQSCLVELPAKMEMLSTCVVLYAGHCVQKVASMTTKPNFKFCFVLKGHMWLVPTTLDGAGGPASGHDSTGVCGPSQSMKPETGFSTVLLKGCRASPCGPWTASVEITELVVFKFLDHLPDLNSQNWAQEFALETCYLHLHPQVILTFSEV